MSFQTQSGDLASIQEVLPAALKTGLSSAGLLLQRKTVKVAPQGGQVLGTAGAGAGNRQLNFLLSAGGGLIDPSSVRLNYNVQVSGTGALVSTDDGHPLSIVNVLLGGQPLEQITSACRLTNMELAVAGSQSYYKTAASFQVGSLLNNDITTVAEAVNQYGFVMNNLTDCKARQTRAASPQTGNITGEPRSFPMSLVSGFFRCKQYIPDALGDLVITAQTLSAVEYVFNAGSTADGDYSMNNISVEYEVVYPDPRYANVLRKVMTDPADALLIAYESAIVSTGAQVTASATSLVENTLIVSRSSTNLTRAAIAFVNAAGQAAANYPGQSAFSHAGIFSAQVRIGGNIYPNQAAQGNASLFNMSLSAYGSPTLESGSITNQALWSQSTAYVTSGTPTSLETAAATYVTPSTTDVRFAYGDKCVIAYGFRAAGGEGAPEMLDGVNTSAAGGAQLQWVIQQAPLAVYQPYVALTAIRVIKCSGSAVSVLGG